MYPLRIFTSDIDLLTEIDLYESIIHTRRWSGVGDFQIVINQNMPGVDHLVEDNIIMIGNDVNRAGIILHREAQVDQTGAESENWTVQGVTLEGIMKRRLTEPPGHTGYDNRNGNAETVMKHYVRNNVTEPSRPERIIEQVNTANDQERGQHVRWQSRYKQLDEELERISITSGMGWFCYIDYDTRKWVFDVSEGRNLTASQTGNPPVIFSPDFDSVAEQQFLSSYLDYANAAYVAGQGEGADRRVIEVGGGEGLDRFETFVDARDVEEEEENEEEEKAPRPIEEIEADLEQRGETDLAEKSRKLSFTCSILTHSPFVYEKDWDLGDIATVQNRKWGVTLDARIEEVEEVIERDKGRSLSVTFGNDMPDFVRMIKREMRKGAV